MAKSKKVTEEVATTVATSNKKTADKAVDSSPAAAKKAEKPPAKKTVSKPALETKQVCFTDQETGKRFCGEVTEVAKDKPTAKVSGSRR